MKKPPYNGIRIETVRVKQEGVYRGRIAVYVEGMRLYTQTSDVTRLSRGDAKQDASIMAHDLTQAGYNPATL